MVVVNGSKTRRSRAVSDASSPGADSAKKKSSKKSTPAAKSRGDKTPSTKRSAASIPKSSAKKTPPKSLGLDPPTFSLEESNGTSRHHGNNGVSLDPDRYELWSIRLPTSVQVSALDGTQISIPMAPAACATGAGILNPPEDGDSSDDGKPYSLKNKKGETFTLRWGNPAETESFRLLVPNPGNNNRKKAPVDSDEDDSSDDSDDDEEEKKQSAKKKKDNTLIPANVPFQRHLKLVSFLKEVPATQLAPGSDRAPAPNVSTTQTGGPTVKLRKAYDTVPQKTGLKRRWIPMGAKGAAQLMEKEAERRNRALSASSILSALSAQAQQQTPSPPKRRKVLKQEEDSEQEEEMIVDAQAKPAASKRKRGSSDSSADKKESKAERKAERERKREAKRLRKEAREAKKQKKEMKLKKEEDEDDD
ncbi:expressed unknown protein [Seminavis robusta]|uniref:Uncharacterized protein n=1 Tax=Seminavis robusta TaxID=568900 RepID=A0A9N8DS69_9STRA|nr:expressed unknown protein [Seminavis robusta]|eukprot:Sro332_g119320.1 n/a (419) ;mRNA; r:41564-42820